MNTTTDYGKPLHQRGNVEEPHMTVVTPAEDVRSIMLNNVSWGAVFAGVVVALVVQLDASKNPLLMAARRCAEAVAR